MKYQYRKWYYKPQSLGTWAHFMYVYEFDYLENKDYKIGYELIASNDLSFKFGMDFEATSDLDYLKDEEYIEVSDNIVKKLKPLMSEANCEHVKDLFK